MNALLHYSDEAAPLVVWYSTNSSPRFILLFSGLWWLRSIAPFRVLQVPSLLSDCDVPDLVPCAPIPRHPALPNGLLARDELTFSETLSEPAKNRQVSRERKVT
jgi:hypothetical protein